LFKWLKHAFATEPAGPLVPDEPERAAVETLAREIVRRRLTVPAVLFLESSRPLNFLGAQLLVFFAPFAQVFFPTEQYEALVRFLERRGSVEYLLERIAAGSAQRGGD
jgi:hypothetical protein